jgi:hypothetical protein
MPYPVTIGGEEITLAWDQQTARAYPYRAGRIGGAPSLRDLANPKRAIAAVTDLLWLFLPPAASAKYPTPEELFLAIDHEANAPGIHAAIVGIVGEMTTTPEKKRSLPSSPLPESNLD